MITLVLGASPNPLRYSHKAVKRLRSHDFDVVAIGKRECTIDDVAVKKGFIPLKDIHTVTLYLGPANQESYLDYIIELKPKRIIFNPGTYNKKLEQMAGEHHIETVEDCTLVMLGTDTY